MRRAKTSLIGKNQAGPETCPKMHIGREKKTTYKKGKRTGNPLTQFVDLRADDSYAGDAELLALLLGLDSN